MWVVVASFCVVEIYGVRVGHWCVFDLEEMLDVTFFMLIHGDVEFGCFYMLLFGEYNIQNVVVVVVVVLGEGVFIFVV